MAVVTSQDLFAKLSEKATLQKVDDMPAFLNTVSTPEEAYEWFKN